MRILVAGGTGFIGANLCEVLLGHGHTVICLDNLLTSGKNNIAPLLQNSHFSFLQANIIEPLPQTLRSIAIDQIYHLASPASPNKKSQRSYMSFPIETLLANSLGTHHLLELAKEKKARFLFASTSEVYGDPLVTPQKEDYFGNVNPNGVRSVYDEGKRFGEAMVMAYVRKYGLDGRIVRIFNTFGPKMQRDDGRVVSNFIIQALSNQPLTIYGDGDQTRSFCYIDDMVRGLMATMDVEQKPGLVINIGNPDEKTIKDLAEIIQRLTRTSAHLAFEPMPEDDPKSRKPDINLAKTLLSWEPRVPLVEGLQKTIEYFKTHSD